MKSRKGLNTVIWERTQNKSTCVSELSGRQSKKGTRKSEKLTSVKT